MPGVFLKRVRGIWIPQYEYVDYVRAQLTYWPSRPRLGATVKLCATFFDDDGNMDDPDSGTVTVTITDPDGTAEVSAAAASEDTEELATYYYMHDIGSSDTAGMWKAKWNAEITPDSETYKIVNTQYFPVEKA